MSHWEEMRSFVRVVEAGSISKAADQVGIAKSGVSRRLADLERRLGVKLINRTTRRSSLTEAGEAYYRGAVRLLGDVAELDAAVADADQRLQGTLRLAVPLTFGLRHLSPAIDEFLQAHPALDVHIDFSDHRIDLVAQGVELAIRIAELDDSSLQARRICPVRMVLCASPDYLAEHGVPEHPADLSRHSVLQYSAGGRQPLRIRDREGQSHPVAGQARIVANNGDFLRDMTAAGHGIYMTPTFIAWEALRDGKLVALLEDCPQPEIAAWAVYPRTRYLSMRARAFIDFLVDRFGEDPYWDRHIMEPS
jgi:DNA-binding transcriptional LysR family regulator